MFVNSFPRLGVHTKYARLGGNEAAAAPLAALLSQWCGFVGEIALLSNTMIIESCNENGRSQNNPSGHGANIYRHLRSHLLSNCL